MNVYDWMKSESPDSPPLNEPGTREDPGNRPHVPDDENGTTRELHSNSGGGRHTVESEHQTEHVITDPENISVSNESIIEDIRKFFKIHNRGKDFVELDGNINAGASKIFATLEKTFANDEWIKKQTPISGKIKVGDLADRLNLDNLLGTIKETAAINDSYQEAVIAAQFVVVKQIQPLMQGLDPKKLTDKAYEKIRDGLSDIKPLTEVIKKPTRSKTNLLTGKVTDDIKQTLTPEETLGLAKEIITAMKQDHSRLMSCNEELERLMGDFFETHWYVRRKGEESESYNTTAWENLCDAVVRKMPGGIPESMAAFRQFEGACVAAVVYMERSFKGGKGVSVEEYTDPVSSNEGFLDAIKDLFKAKPKDLEIKGGVDKHNLKQIEDTLLNENWLKRQKFTEGEVTVRFPDAAQDGNYKPLVGRIEKELTTVAKYNEGKAAKWMNPFKQAIDIIVEGRVGSVSLEQVEKLRKVADYDSIDFDVDYKEPNNFLKDDAEIQLPALDTKGIKDAVETLIKLVEIRDNYCRVSVNNIPGGIPTASMHKILAVRDEETQEALKDLHEEVSSILDYAIESFFQNQYAYYDLTEGLAVPLINWIKASISGVKYDN